MAWGTDAFTNRDGDYKQPTIIDLDKEYGKKKAYEKPMIDNSTYKEELIQWRKDTIDFILKSNPFFLAKEFDHLIKRENNKLEWDVDKLLDTCQNDRILSDMSNLIRNRKERGINFTS